LLLAFRRGLRSIFLNMSAPKSDDCENQMPRHSIAWNELMTSDPAAAVKFYGALFGWTTEIFHPAPGMDYTIFKNGSESFGGVMNVKQPGSAPYWVNYVSVEKLEPMIEKAASLGAKTLLPPMSIGEAGRIAIIADPQGAPVGLHEYKG
jgi:uncharacterized protein